MSNVDQLPPARSTTHRRIGHREQMGSRELSIAGEMLARMALKPGERVLNLNCGSGWATRIAAQAVDGDGGMAAGLDASPEMISEARVASRELHNVLYAVGDAEEIPWRDEYFNRAVCIQGFEYYPDPEAVLRELYRVLALGGKLHILVSLGEDLRAQAGASKHPVHLRSEEDYEQMLSAAGFVDATVTHVADSRPPAGHCEGTLMLVARRP